jgi:hypothetical protein
LQVTLPHMLRHTGLDPPAGPKPLRRGEGPRNDQICEQRFSKRDGLRVKPGNDERLEM